MNYKQIFIIITRLALNKMEQFDWFLTFEMMARPVKIRRY